MAQNLTKSTEILRPILTVVWQEGPGMRDTMICLGRHECLGDLTDTVGRRDIRSGLASNGWERHQRHTG